MIIRSLAQYVCSIYEEFTGLCLETMRKCIEVDISFKHVLCENRLSIQGVDSIV